MPATVATTSGLPPRLGKYELLMPLAAGGMARIYIARTTGIGSFERHVVLKLITPERASDATAVGMFLDEARLAASLNHQNVAQVFEVGEDVGIHYLAMEYVHGQDLRSLLAKAGSQGTRIPLELALTVVAGAAAGLNHAHERRGQDGQPLGIVHRDVSPSNIMIGYDGAVKLLDFGIAKATHRSVETQSGIIKGKFAYMAPEQCRGRDVDRRSDVFSLGIILYEISTQHRCFRADSDFDTMHRIVTGDVVRPTRLVPTYPQALEAIVMKALAVDAAQRYQSAGLLLEALESFAVASRMSLSTMGLGRFMRDMFGEQPEPWLQPSRNSAVMPKENTISSTDGRGSEPAKPIPEPPVEEGRFENSDKNPAARTVLDLPRSERGEPHDTEPPPSPEWNDPKEYPGSQPQIASSSTLPPDAVVQPMNAPRTPTPVPRPTPTPQPAVLAHPPAGTVPPSTAKPGSPSGAFATPPSGSGPALQQPGIPSTRHGYASPMSRADNMSYPRYESTPGVDDMKIGDRRPLYLGVGVLVLGLVIVLFVVFRGGGSKDESSNSVAPSPGSGSDSASGVATEPAVVASTPGSATAPVPPPVEDMVTVHVVSHPAGAEVSVAGAVIGVTPLDKKLARGKKAELRVHLDGYVDYTSRIDLTGDELQKDVTLKKVVDTGDDSGSKTPPGTTEPAGNPTIDDDAKAKKEAEEKAAEEKAAAEKAAEKA
ncbi:MAG TPA: protein kinase, partial [Kofleriaceae bacterium]|nr:protein kinase [Kofleriaceae bacterium]